MNIGIFSDTYYPQVNGVVTSIRMLEDELQKRGHKVFIFTTTDPKDRQKRPNVFRLPSMPFVFLPTMRLGILYPPLLLLKMRRFKFDVIHTQTEFPIGIFGKIVSEFTRAPLVHTYHTMYEDYVHYLMKGHLVSPKMAQGYSRLFCNRADMVIAPVEKAKDSLVKYGVKKPIRIAPTGINFEPFRKFDESDIIELKNELGLDESVPIVLYLGRLAKEKSVDVILNQFPALLEKLPNTKLVIVGDGPNREALAELTLKLGVKESVIFTGAKPWEVIGKYYKLGDIFVTASTSETQGLTYIEAMAAGTPVVAKFDKSVEGVLTDGETGYCFYSNDEAAEVMYRALIDIDGRKNMAKTAFERINHLSSAKFAETVESIYTEAIEFSKKNKKRRKH